MPGPRSHSCIEPVPLRPSVALLLASAGPGLSPRSGTLVSCPTVLPEREGAPGILQAQRPCSSGLGVPLRGDRERKTQPLAGVPRFSSEGQVPLGLRAHSPPGSLLLAPPALAPVVLTAGITSGHRQRTGAWEVRGSELQEAGPGLRLVVRGLTLTSHEEGRHLPTINTRHQKIVGSQGGLGTARPAHGAEGCRASVPPKLVRTAQPFLTPTQSHPASRPPQPLLQGRQADCPGSREGDRVTSRREEGWRRRGHVVNLLQTSMRIISVPQMTEAQRCQVSSPGSHSWFVTGFETKRVCP